MYMLWIMWYQYAVAPANNGYGPEAAYLRCAGRAGARPHAGAPPHLHAPADAAAPADVPPHWVRTRSSPALGSSSSSHWLDFRRWLLLFVLLLFRVHGALGWCCFCCCCVDRCFILTLRLLDFEFFCGFSFCTWSNVYVVIEVERRFMLSFFFRILSILEYKEIKILELSDFRCWCIIDIAQLSRGCGLLKEIVLYEGKFATIKNYKFVLRWVMNVIINYCWNCF